MSHHQISSDPAVRIDAPHFLLSAQLLTAEISSIGSDNKPLGLCLPNGDRLFEGNGAPLTWADAVFAAGTVEPAATRDAPTKWVIRPDTPTVVQPWLLKSIRNAGHEIDLPTTGQARNADLVKAGDMPADKSHPRILDENLRLGSGGSYLTIVGLDGAEKLALLRRTPKAYKPNFLTMPAGVVGEPMTLTAIKELNEELAVVYERQDDALLLLIMDPQGRVGISADIKAQQIEQAARLMHLADKPVQIVTISATTHALDQQFYQTVQTVLRHNDGGDQIIDSCNGILGYENGDFSSLYFAASLQLNLADLNKKFGPGILRVCDGENFDEGGEIITRHSGLYTADAIMKEQALPWIPDLIMRRRGLAPAKRYGNLAAYRSKEPARQPA